MLIAAAGGKRKEEKFQILQIQKCDASRSTFHNSFIPNLKMLTTLSKH